MKLFLCSFVFLMTACMTAPKIDPPRQPAGYSGDGLASTGARPRHPQADPGTPATALFDSCFNADMNSRNKPQQLDVSTIRVIGSLEVSGCPVTIAWLDTKAGGYWLEHLQYSNPTVCKYEVGAIQYVCYLKDQ